MFLEKEVFQNIKTRADIFQLAKERNYKLDKLKWDLDYEKQLKKLQAELVNLQKWIYDNKLRVAILFEGRDAAGKGGSIKRFTERYKETFTEQISIYPYNLESGLTSIGGDMDTVVKKCAYDTQIHDHRSKWYDNLYLLMGKAFYFKNDYESAITAFQYVVNEYKDGDLKKKQKRGYKKT